MLLLSVFGATWAQKTYHLEQVTSVEASSLYVFEQGGHVMNNTVSNSALQTIDTYSSEGLSGTESYVWKLEKATNGFKMRNVSLSAANYLSNSSSTSVSFNNSGSVWFFNFQIDETAIIQNKSFNDRFLGYTSTETYAYRAYATSNLESESYPHAIKVYKLVKDNVKPAIANVIDISPRVIPQWQFDNNAANTGEFELPGATFAANAKITYSSSNIGILNTWSNEASYNETEANPIENFGYITVTNKDAVGKITLNVTVTPWDTDTYDEVNTEFDICIVNDRVGSEENAGTVIEARAMIDAGELDEIFKENSLSNYYVKGIVSEIVTPYNPEYGDISYNISVDGSTDSPQLLVYRGKGINGVEFTSTDDIKVGDQVVVKGNLKLYDTLYEFASGNQLVSNTGPVPIRRGDLNNDGEVNIMDVNILINIILGKE
jgi:hypothetical protein